MPVQNPIKTHASVCKAWSAGFDNLIVNYIGRSRMSTFMHVHTELSFVLKRINRNMALSSHFVSRTCNLVNWRCTTRLTNLSLLIRLPILIYFYFRLPTKRRLLFIAVISSKSRGKKKTKQIKQPISIHVVKRHHGFFYSKTRDQ